MTNTPHGAKKGIATLRKKRGKQYLIDRARKAGLASQTFKKDNELARSAGKKGLEVRWGKK